jgi:hypothetical protein
MFAMIAPLRVVAGVCVVACGAVTAAAALAPNVDAYNVVWDSPSKDSSGSMPLGNGDIGVNVWAEADGALVLCISKTDAWDASSRLLKLGLAGVKATPNPFAKGSPFRQTLKLREGEIEIVAGDGPAAATFTIWVDAKRPVIRIDIACKTPLKFQSGVQSWRSQQHTLAGPELHGVEGFAKGAPPVCSADVFRNDPDRVLWYHRNETSLWPSTLKHQDLENLTEKLSDPLLCRTFGGIFKPTHRPQDSPDDTNWRYLICIYCLTAQTPNVDAWTKKLGEIVAENEAITLERARSEHRAWWEAFWNRSWIHVTGTPGADVARGYALQRFLNACAGRGGAPIKSNGSIFNLDAPEGQYHLSPDYRRWGGAYWFRDTRLPYWSMLAAGDFDLMQPLFAMYQNAMALAAARTRIYYKHDGVFFPETMYFWGTYCNGDLGYGWDREGKTVGLADNPYIRYHWQGGLELAAMMLDHYEMTADKAFAKTTLVPIAHGVVTFYAQHWKPDAAGKIHLEPAQALETWQEAVNPLPEIAGLRSVLTGLLALPMDVANDAQRRTWKKTLTDLPPLPMKTEGGKRWLLPAETYGKNSGTENPELYAVFPYRLFGVGKPDLGVALETWQRRQTKRTGGWSQDPIQAAYLGLAKEAAEYTARNFASSDPRCRFPAFWGPNTNWTPDQGHGGASMIALQRMLLQADGRKIFLLPAWPRDWDCDFKLHAPMNTTVEGAVRGGRLSSLKVTPQVRLRDVVKMEPQ